MLCPCCGSDIQHGVRECGCGAQFVGKPLDEKPVQIPSFGAVMLAIGLLALVTTTAMVFTKFLAFGAVLVIYSARRAMKLAKSEPERYGGFKVATATLIITVLASSVAAGFAIAYIPRFLENRQAKKDAASKSDIYRYWEILEKYRLAKGSYPQTDQDLKKFTREQLPADYWGNTIKYEGYTDGLAKAAPPKKDVNNKYVLPAANVDFYNFELRSIGADGKANTEDDIIMRDGIFYTYEESKKLTSVKASSGR